MTQEVTTASLTIRKIGLADLKDALSKGLEDSLAMPSFHVFLALLYPVALMWFTGYASALIFPLMAGFALVGPFVGIGLYEMSRCRELGLDTSWGQAFEAVRSRSLFPILLVGLFLLVIFLCWIFAAITLYAALFATAPPKSFDELITLIFAAPQGWKLIGYGTAIGLIFAVGAFSISVISFPLLLDRDVRSRSLFAILLVGLFLLVIFLSWIFVAISLYAALFATAPPKSFAELITLIFATPQGWKLIGYGTAIGFVFAVGPSASASSHSHYFWTAM